MSGIRHLVVSVPAHNEEALLGRCLQGIAASVEALRNLRPGIVTTVCVGLDRCTDRSAVIARNHGASTVTTTAPGVGAARDASISAGLRRMPGLDPQNAWLACTDADTLVGRNWLLRHVMWAERGYDLVVGTVEPGEVWDAGLLAAWHDRHQLAEGHPHVHGANLGVRASRWRQAGGFGPLELHEDVGLVDRVRAATDRWVATDTIRVRTSGRLLGRVDGGFASYLTHLDAVP